MPVINPISVDNNDAVNATPTVLDGSDTFTYKGNGAILVLHNPTGGSLSPILDGANGTTVECQGVGDIDVSGGTDTFGAIGAGATKALKLSRKSEYLRGVTTITGGTGLEATLIEQ